MAVLTSDVIAIQRHFREFKVFIEEQLSVVDINADGEIIIPN